MSYKDYAGASASTGIIDLGGGLNSTASPLSLSDNQASDLLNVDFDVFGSMRSRDGYLNLNSDPVLVSGAVGVGVYNFNLNKSNTTTLTSVFGDGFFKMDDLDGTWDAVTLSGATITSGANSLFSFTQLDDVMLFTNGIDQPLIWLGGSNNTGPATVPTGLTDARFTETWNNYVFLANVQVSSTWYRSRFYWSDLSDIYTWQDYNWIEVQNDDGEEITGIYAFGDRLVIFKGGSIHNVLFTGDKDIPFLVIKSKSSVGCVSHFSVREYDNKLIFLSNDGLYEYDGTNSSKISDKLNYTFSQMEKSRFQYCTSEYIHSKDTYLLSISTSGSSTNNRIIIFNTVKRSFSVWDGIACNYLATIKYQGEERVYFQDYSGYCYRMFIGIDDYPLGVQTAINSYWKSKWFDFGNIVDKKGMIHFIIYYKINDNSITFGYSYDLSSSDRFSQSIDMGTSSAVYDDAEYDISEYASEGGLLQRIDLQGRGRLFRFCIYNSALSEQFHIYGAGFYPHLETVS